MAQQKSENHVVPKGRRKSVPTWLLEGVGGGKVVPVKEAEEQRRLAVVTAENPWLYRGADDMNAVDLFTVEVRKVPKTTSKPRQASPVTKEPMRVSGDNQRIDREIPHRALHQTGPRSSIGIVGRSIGNCVALAQLWLSWISRGRDPADGGVSNPPS